MESPDNTVALDTPLESPNKTLGSDKLEEEFEFDEKEFSNLTDSNGNLNISEISADEVSLIMVYPTEVWVNIWAAISCSTQYYKPRPIVFLPLYRCKVAGRKLDGLDSRPESFILFIQLKKILKMKFVFRCSIR